MLDARAAPDAGLRAARMGQAAWSALGVRARAAVIRRAAAGLGREAEAMAAIIASASGRPAAEIWGSEIVPTLDALAWLAREGSRSLAPVRLRRSALQWYFRGTHHRLTWEPYGVLGVVTPDNGWLFLTLPQIAAALLAGNAVIWKPSPGAAATAPAVAALFQRAGLPPAVLQILPGGAAAALGLVRAGVDKLHFTGGSEAGGALYREQAARGRPAVLELSGRHVSVVLDPCDLELAARGILWGKRANRGRNCVSVQLVLAEGGAFEPLLAALATAVRDAGAEDGKDAPGEAERGRLSALASDALARGARRIGGSLADVLILAPVEPGMRMVDEEVLGPLLGVAPIEAGARAVEWINRGGHRLSASVWASDRRRARRLAEALDVGQVWINEQLHPTAQPAVALAGRGASGFGATRGRAGLMEMVQVKVVSETPAAVRRPHYAGAHPGAADLLRATVGLRFGRGLGGRVGAAALAARALVGLARGPR